MNPSAALRQQALAQPDHPAILWEGGVMTYAAFEDRVARMAGGLQARLAPGAHVALVMENCPEFLPALYAIWRAGMVAVPVNAKLHPREHAWILENSEAALCLASPALGAALQEETRTPVAAVGTPLWDALDGPAVREADTKPDDLAWLFYTSGTTGRPKGAMITHRNLVAASLAYCADVDFIGPDDIRLHAAPLTHGSGLYAVPFILKGAQNLIPRDAKPETTFQALATHRNVSFFAAPTMVSRLTAHPLADQSDHPGLKTLEYGGAPMYLADLKRALQVFGPRLYQVFGQGEAPMTITHITKAMHADTAHPRYWERLATAGVPRSGCEVRVVDADGRPLPTGETGEIATRSDVVVPGYWKNAEATAKALKDGWLMTGDVGALDDEGFLSIKDRSKDMVISGGMNIYPREIEEVLLTHPGVTECSVVGKPDPDWGESLVAFVVGQATRDELDQLCLENLARFKRPKDWRFIQSLPKNNYGKIVKTELRALLEDDA